MKHARCKCHLFFETIGTELKVNIIFLLKERDLSVTEIVERLDGEERSNVSHSLKTLLECNIVQVKNEGRKRIYSLNKDTIVPLLDLVDKHMQMHCKVCRKIKP